ncbi:hypothetical protein X777_16298 [Ooceraea biroi]|uniref:Uncharacterized protein n=1 Tax=Ooceraea biroi TaxID=2015173 RepID=A0A026VUC6_OOCBI|nr:hypothetical protein X777_16298 [Ooceraea biroi]
MKTARAGSLEFHFRHILESPPAFTHMLVLLYPAALLVWTQLYRGSQDLANAVVDRGSKMFRRTWIGTHVKTAHPLGKIRRNVRAERAPSSNASLSCRVFPVLND